MADIIKFPGGHQIEAPTEKSESAQCKKQIEDLWNDRESNPNGIQTAVEAWVGLYSEDFLRAGIDWKLIAKETMRKVQSADERSLSPAAVTEEIVAYFRSLGLNPNDR